MTATPPFPDARVSKVAARHQSTLWSTYSGGKRVFSAHCCNINSAGIMGVAKTPVLLLNLEPNPICLGSVMQWSLASSYAPGSTITAWSISFDVGDAAADYDETEFSGGDISTASGEFEFLAAGEYEITASVTEGLGKSKSSTQVAYVNECPDMIWTYKSLDGDGVFFIDWTPVVPEWEARNTGLEGDALNVRKLILNPSTTHLKDEYHKLWIATLGGVYNTHNGGRTWFRNILGDPDTTVWDDGSSHSESELDCIDITYDPNNVNTLYVLAKLDNAEYQRSWVYKTTNNGISWTNKPVVTLVES